jgi:hypothetical protein
VPDGASTFVDAADDSAESKCRGDARQRIISTAPREIGGDHAAELPLMALSRHLSTYFTHWSCR